MAYFYLLILRFLSPVVWSRLSVTKILFLGARICGFISLDPVYLLTVLLFVLVCLFQTCSPLRRSSVYINVIAIVAQDLANPPLQSFLFQHPFEIDLRLCLRG